jgi:hypothetical protein
MAIVKELNTRIALKYDSYANWTTAPGKDLVLLAGEIGICEIPAVNGDSRVAPTVLFKVGNGSKKFYELPWASAKAADVYSWAKAETVVLDGEVIKFKTGEEVVHQIDLSKFALNTELNAAIERIAALEADFGTEGIVTDHEARLDVLEGADTVDGSVAKALKDAKAYTDDREAAIKLAYEAYADQAEADAIAKAEEKVDVERKRINKIDEDNAARDKNISDNAAAIAKEAEDRAAADAAINEKFGAEYSKTATVAAAIADAKKAGTDAAAAVTALSDGQVKTNKEDIAKNKEDIADLNDALDEEIQLRKDADKGLSDRLDSIEAFFNAADHDGQDGGLTDALDTLKEIQDYLNGDGSAAGSVVDRIAANEDAIADLEDLFVEGGAFNERVEDVEEAVATLQDIVDGYTDKGAIKTAVDAAQGDATQALADADNAAKAAKAAQDDVDALERVVGDANSGLVKAVADVTGTANKNKEDIAGLTTRMGTAEGNISTLQGIVSTGDDSNANLRQAITALQTLTGDANKGNEKLRSDLTALADIVNDADTGLAKTKAIADGAATLAASNAERLSVIEGDYLKAADDFIINCGSSTKVVHVKA